MSASSAAVAPFELSNSDSAVLRCQENNLPTRDLQILKKAASVLKALSAEKMAKYVSDVAATVHELVEDIYHAGGIRQENDALV